MEYNQESAIDKPDPVPSAQACLDGLSRHIQAYDASLGALAAENKLLREQTAFLTQQIESLKLQLLQSPSGSRGAPSADLLAKALPRPSGPPVQPPAQKPAASEPQLSDPAVSVTSTVVTVRPGGQTPRDATQETPPRTAAAPGIAAAQPLQGRKLPPHQLVHVRTLQMHSRAVTALLWMHEFFLSCSRDGSARAWYLPRDAADNSRFGPLQTLRCEHALTALANVENHYVLLADTSGALCAYSLTAGFLANTVVHAPAEDLNRYLLWTNNGAKSLQLSSPCWAMVEVTGGCGGCSGSGAASGSLNSSFGSNASVVHPSVVASGASGQAQVLCIGSGSAALIEIDRASLTYRQARASTLPDPADGHSDEALLIAFATALKHDGLVYGVCRERFWSDDRMLPADYVPQAASELAGLGRSGLRICLLDPDAGTASASASGAPGAGGSGLDQSGGAPGAAGFIREIFELAGNFAAPIHPTALATYLDRYVVVATSTADCKLCSYRSGDTCIKRVHLRQRDVRDAEIFSALAAVDGYLFAVTHCAPGETGTFYAFSVKDINGTGTLELSRLDCLPLDGVLGCVTAVTTRKIDGGYAVVLSTGEGEIFVKLYAV